MKKVFIITMLSILLTACSNNHSTGNNTETFAENKNITITINVGDEKNEVDGIYNGELHNNRADGKGEFIREIDNTILKYQGDFSDGEINGHGNLTITNDVGETISFYGTFSNGQYTPTMGELYNFIGQLDLFGKFSLDDDVINYIDSKSNLFPKATSEEIEKTEIKEYSNKQFKKTRKQDDIGIVKVNLRAAQVFEDEYSGRKITYLLAVDGDGDFYTLYYLDTADIYENDNFTAYVLPCATSSFNNVGGGVTNVTVMILSFINKY